MIFSLIHIPSNGTFVTLGLLVQEAWRQNNPSWYDVQPWRCKRPPLLSDMTTFWGDGIINFALFSTSCKRPHLTCKWSNLHVCCMYYATQSLQGTFSVSQCTACIVARKMYAINSLRISRCLRPVPWRDPLWFKTPKRPPPVSDHYILAFWVVA